MSRADRRSRRVLDANGNRAREGLRVVEDILRFCLDDSRLSASTRALRHSIGRSIESMVPRRSLLDGRDSEGDVGAKRWKAGRGRSRISDLLVANLRRAQESARVIEEFSRLLGKPAETRRLQSIRYALYTLEVKSLALLERGRNRR